MPLQEKMETLRSRYAAAIKGGGQARIDKQHQGNKLTARERVAAFLDEGSFEEVDALAMNPFDGGERMSKRGESDVPDARYRMTLTPDAG